MASAVAISSAEAGDRIKLMVNRLGNIAFYLLDTLAGDYIADRRFLKQVINMPVEFFILFKVAV